MEEIVKPLLLILGSALASSGFWSFLQNRKGRKDKRLDLLLGLAHDRIIHLGTNYVNRGWITYDEYEDLLKYLYEPYEAFGGNGLAKRVMDEVSKLPVKTMKESERIKRDNREP